jgi:hypothetical protein
MRLCNQYIPDVQRVSACMSAYRRYLSPVSRRIPRRPEKESEAPLRNPIFSSPPAVPARRSRAANERDVRSSAPAPAVTEGLFGERAVRRAGRGLTPNSEKIPHVVTNGRHAGRAR